jgi:hypothetical protein
MAMQPMNNSSKRRYGFSRLYGSCPRYFEHALENDKARAEKVLLWMQELYAVEKEAREKNLSAQDRYLLRQQKALP